MKGPMECIVGHIYDGISYEKCPYCELFKKKNKRNDTVLVMSPRPHKLICNKCYSTNNSYALFCGNCGISLKDATNGLAETNDADDLNSMVACEYCKEPKPEVDGYCNMCGKEQEYRCVQFD